MLGATEKKHSFLPAWELLIIGSGLLAVVLLLEHDWISRRGGMAEDEPLVIGITALLGLLIVAATIVIRARRDLAAATSDLEIRFTRQADELVALSLTSSATINSMVDGVITADEIGMVRSFNPAAQSIFGYDAVEVIGRSVSMLMPEPHSSKHDDYIRTYLSTGVTKVIGVGREVVGRRKDGSAVPLELTVTEIHPRESRLFVGIVRDITERKRAEQQMRLHLGALEAAANAIVITDSEGRVRWVNTAFTRLTRYAAEEVIGQSTNVLKSGSHEPAFYSNLWATITAGKIWHGEIVNRRKDGSLYTEEMTITPVRGSDGEIMAYVAIKQDVTQRKEIERMKSEFISTVSHELRTPLTSIRGSLGLLAGGVAGELPAAARPLVEIAAKNSERLSRLINDILDMEKIEAGEVVFEMKPMELMPQIEMALEANRPFADALGVSFEIAGLLPGVSVKGDSDRLQQVLTNLLSNASKYSPRGERVTVTLSRNGDRIRVSVADRGRGIPEEFRERIFHKFAQADSSDTREKSGTGLGLAIAKAIVEQMGGRIGYETETGKGTTFFFDLPEWRQEGAAVPATETDRQGG